MRFLNRSTVVMAAVTMSLVGLLGQTNVAGAAAPDDVITSAGQGTISPSLPTTGCAPSAPHITFDGTGLVAGPDAQLATIHFAGDSTSGCASLTADSGTGTLSGTLSGNVSYARTGNVVTMAGTATLGARTFSVSWICVWVWFSVGPASGFAWVCV